jgi:Recombination endonuclease VII
MMKVCVRCLKSKPSDRFEPRRRTCRDRVNAANRAKGRRTYTSDRQRLYEYGMQPDAYRNLVFLQAGRCLVCGRIPEKLVVDHDHTTGTVRGLLCDRCNRALGHLKDDAGNCERAAEYLLGFADR